MSETPSDRTDANREGDAAFFDCLREFAERAERGEVVLPESYRDRLGAEYERFVGLLDMEGLLAETVEPDTPDVELPTAAAGRYRDFRAVGEGGMGLVYWAIDTTLNREVAFKIIKPKRQGDAAPAPAEPYEIPVPEGTTPASIAFRTLRQRFLQEAWVTSGMAHPGIVPVYELGETPKGVPYYTMRFVKGERTLADSIRAASRRSVEERLHLLEPFLKICDAVRYAHARGVVHRDLKPQNVALGEFGEVVVLDWGLAKLDKDQDLTQSIWQERVHEYRSNTDLKTATAALGTPGYMSPEAAKGDIAAIDERSDVYSLGVILYEMLTGRLPFAFDSYAHLVRQLLREVPPRADAVETGVPAGLASLCERSLAGDPAERLGSVGELADGVRAWQAQVAVEREVEDLLQRAGAALDASEDASGEARLRQVERARASLAQVQAKWPDSPRARALSKRAAGLRATGLKEREKESTRRLLVWGGGAVLVAAALAGLFVANEFDKRADEARSERDAKAVALGEKSRALDEVLRLSDVKKVRDLEDQAKLLRVTTADLESISGIWLRDRAGLVARTAEHKERLEALRTRARGEGPPYQFADRATGWRHDVLSDLVERLRDFASPDHVLVLRVQRLHQLAKEVRQVDARSKEAWAFAISQIAKSDRYGGLKLVPQRALVPLGPDPESGLHEFGHVGSGRLPTRDPRSGALRLGDDATIVLVLLPGGTYAMGAQSRDPKQRNYDPLAQPFESPVHEVTLSPFFIGKEEVTQAQWRALTGGENPAVVKGDRLPATDIMWDACMYYLPQFGLELPTEAQWEYACRGGTSTPWWTGDSWQEMLDRLSDGVFVAHSRLRGVGKAPANPYGLHDMHAGPREFCWDTLRRYEREPATDPRTRVGFQDIVVRPNGDRGIGQYRSASRNYRTRRGHGEGHGVRAARALDAR